MFRLMSVVFRELQLEKYRVFVEYHQIYQHTADGAFCLVFVSYVIGSCYKVVVCDNPLGDTLLARAFTENIIEVTQA